MRLHTQIVGLALKQVDTHAYGVEMRWNEYDRHKVAEMLLIDFPRLSIDKLLAAIRECDHEVRPEAGWDKLAECARERLKKSGGTGKR